LRATFEIKFLASNLNDAKAVAKTRISNFLGISEKDFDDLVSLELKITNLESEKTDEKATSSYLSEELEVTAYGTLKSNVTKL
jgi:hypothetical protein